MEKECISVIIPVYNCEKYIFRCLESVSKQMYKNLQIIVIDDGSVDKSLEICKKFANSDSRIEVYSKKNGGVSSARNLGLKKVKGDFVSFIDADDYLELDMYSKMMKNIKDEEIIICNFYNVYENGKRENGVDIPQRICNSKEALKELFLNRFVIGALWNKLFSYNIIKNLEFDLNYTIGEDLLYGFFAINNCEKIRFINDRLYNYYINNSNSTSNVSYKKWKQIIYVCDKISGFLDKELLQLWKIKKFKSYRLIIAKIICQPLEKEDVAYLKDILFKSKEYIKIFMKFSEIKLREKIYTICLYYKANKIVRKYDKERRKNENK